MMLLTLALLTATPPAPAFWGPMGHRLVVELAWDLLTPRARSAADALLAGEPPEEAALWADRIRNERRDTGPLHYVNIPVGAAAYDPVRDCPKDACIVTAIRSYRAALADSTASPAARAEALRFLIHFVADLHQPLHDGNRDDRGGNLIEVRWLGRDTNLHALWDTDLLTSWALDEGGYLKRLRATIKRMDSSEREQDAAGSVVDWAMEGNRLAAIAYTAHQGESLGAEYLRSAGPILDRQILKAGLRLARTLNEALDPKE